jgi:hypothetical protein
MKKFIPQLALLSLLLMTAFANAQSTSTDEESASEEVVIDNERVKVIVKEKKTITTNEDGEEVEEVEEIRIITNGSESGEEDREIEDIEVIIKGKDTLNGDMSIKEIIQVIKDLEESAEAEDLEELEEMLVSVEEDCEVRPNDYKYNRVESDWFNIQWGFNNLINGDNKLEMPVGSENLELNTSNSANLHLHIVQQSVRLYRNNIRLVYGVGIDFNNYRFNKNVNLAPDSIPLKSTINTIDYKKNKLVTQYLTVPLMLDFNFGKKDDGFKLAFGGNFGYLIGSHQKLKWSDNTGKNKIKVRDDFNLEQFRMGYEVQFGYGAVMLYGKYFPQSIFQANEGPDLRTVSAGIMIGHI